jgi:hypothetical protein
MNGHSVPTEQDHFQAARQYQEYYDDKLKEIGVRAPSPVIGQSVNDYRRETLRTLKRSCLPRDHELYAVQYRALKTDSLAALEPQCLQACVAETNNPVNVPLGELRAVNQLDEAGRLVARRFIGQESFVKQLGRPGRRVEAFAANGRLFDAKRGTWR